MEAAPRANTVYANMSGGGNESGDASVQHGGNPPQPPTSIHQTGNAHSSMDEEVEEKGWLAKGKAMLWGEEDSLVQQGQETVVAPTISEQARAVQATSGDTLTTNQISADRLIDSWKPQFKAAEHEHEALTIRIDDTRELWTEYLEVQNEYIEKVSNSNLQASMRGDLENDQQAFSKWDRKAGEVQAQSEQAMTTLRDMDYMIEFQRNRADLRAVIGQESLEIASEITTLLESLDQFETQTEALSLAISG